MIRPTTIAKTQHVLLDIVTKLPKTIYDVLSLFTTVSTVIGALLTVELGFLERLNLADVDVLHGVDALHSLEDLSGDVLGDAATRDTPTTTFKKQRASQKKANHPGLYTVVVRICPKIKPVSISGTYIHRTRLV